MAAKTASVKVGERTVMVRELVLSEIFELLNAQSRPAVESICHLLSLCTDTDRDTLMQYSPSEIEPMVQKLLELNADFFAQAETLKEPEISAAMRKKILRISMLAYLQLSPPATE